MSYRGRDKGGWERVYRRARRPSERQEMADKVSLEKLTSFTPILMSSGSLVLCEKCLTMDIKRQNVQPVVSTFSNRCRAAQEGASHIDMKERSKVTNCSFLLDYELYIVLCAGA